MAQSLFHNSRDFGHAGVKENLQQKRIHLVSAQVDALPGKQVTTDPDEVLLERIARGDMAAVSALVSRKLPRLLSLGRRMLNDPAEAEDVAQETLVRTWKQAATWVPGRARIDTWMHRVALNLCYDRLRRRKDSVSPDDVEIIDDAAGPSVQLEQAQTAQALQKALAQLPERQRTAITLNYFQEMSNIEAAAIMGVSIEALESLLARARRTLRTLMSETSVIPGSTGARR
ncbi:RNA polymerase sigma factor [Asticcacaulis taihuensis]|uniref:RNA polymerase sigma factor n=1 Tax=Asticcacaulis taihuensis TaxID=260084 RepID=UPI003F7CA123